MKKFSRAFVLKSIQDYPVYAIKINDIWYPCKEDIKKNKDIFISGLGWIKILRKYPLELVGNLPIDWTAEDIQKIGNKYSVYVAMGMLEGWGSGSLYDDGSYGLNHAKYEIVNMVRFGKIYDDFTDQIQAIGNEFIKELLKKGFIIDGNFLYYNEEFIGFLDRLQIHLLQYMDSLIKGLIPVKPMFDPISFDKFLKTLMVAKDPKSIDIHVSVKDRITYLTNQDIADKIQNIFKLQKVFDKV